MKNTVFYKLDDTLQEKDYKNLKTALQKSIHLYKNKNIFFIQVNSFDVLKNIQFENYKKCKKCFISLKSSEELTKYFNKHKYEEDPRFSYTITDSTNIIKVFFNKNNFFNIPYELGCKYKSLEEYKLALINHELAHVLGHGHVKCPKPGLPSDTRQQPSRDLGGCLPTTDIIFYSKTQYPNLIMYNHNN